MAEQMPHVLARYDGRPVFQGLLALVGSGFSGEALQALMATAELVEDPRTSEDAFVALADALIAEGALGGPGVPWEREQGRSDPHFDREGALKASVPMLLARLLAREPKVASPAEGEPVVEVLKASFRDPQSFEAMTLEAICGGAPIQSPDAVRVLGDLAFQNGADIGQWARFMIAKGAKPFLVGCYLLGMPLVDRTRDLSGGVVALAASEVLRAEVAVVGQEAYMHLGHLLRGYSGHSLDLGARLDLLWASGLFQEPQDVVTAVSGALAREGAFVLMGGTATPDTSCFSVGVAQDWSKAVTPRNLV